jgi:hypothetical protein
MHLLAERFVFGGDDRGILKEGVKNYLMAQYRILTRPFIPVITSIAYGVNSQ